MDRDETDGCHESGIRGVCKTGEEDQEVQIPSYKINKSWRCNVYSTGNTDKNIVSTLYGNK